MVKRNTYGVSKREKLERAAEKIWLKYVYEL